MSLPPSTKNRVRLASNLMLTVSKVACVYETSQASITGSLRLVKNHCGSEVSCYPSCLTLLEGVSSFTWKLKGASVEKNTAQQLILSWQKPMKKAKWKRKVGVKVCLWKEFVEVVCEVVHFAEGDSLRPLLNFNFTADFRSQVKPLPESAGRLRNIEPKAATKSCLELRRANTFPHKELSNIVQRGKPVDDTEDKENAVSSTSQTSLDFSEFSLPFSQTFEDRESNSISQTEDEIETPRRSEREDVGESQVISPFTLLEVFLSAIEANNFEEISNIVSTYGPENTKTSKEPSLLGRNDSKIKVEDDTNDKSASDMDSKTLLMFIYQLGTQFRSQEAEVRAKEAKLSKDELEQLIEAKHEAKVAKEESSHLEKRLRSIEKEVQAREIEFTEKQTALKTKILLLESEDNKWDEYETAKEAWKKDLECTQEKLEKAELQAISLASRLQLVITENESLKKNSKWSEGNNKRRVGELNTTLQRALEEARSTKERAAQEISDQQYRLECAQEANVELGNTCSALEAQMEELRKILGAQQQTNQSYAETVEECKASIHALKGIIDQQTQLLVTEMSRLSHQQVTIDTQEQTIRAQEATIHDLQLTISDQDESLAINRDLCATLKDVAELKQKIQAKQTNYISSLNSSLASCIEETKDQKATIQMLQETVGFNEKTIEAKDAELRSVDKLKEEWEQTQKMFLNKIAHQAETVSQLTTKNRLLEESKTFLVGKISEMKKEQEELRNQNKELCFWVDQVKSLVGRANF